MVSWKFWFDFTKDNISIDQYVGIYTLIYAATSEESDPKAFYFVILKFFFAKYFFIQSKMTIVHHLKNY